ncbi:MAG TPA: hypothetical protein VN897_12810 [Mycobacterium sp.]|nr:hypothetical protein [Mycobacterium sp.]
MKDGGPLCAARRRPDGGPAGRGQLAVSLWLNSGVSATEVARRAGHDVEVLLAIGLLICHQSATN